MPRYGLFLGSTTFEFVTPRFHSPQQPRDSLMSQAVNIT